MVNIKLWLGGFLIPSPSSYEIGVRVDRRHTSSSMVDVLLFISFFIIVTWRGSNYDYQ